MKTYLCIILAALFVGCDPNPPNRQYVITLYSQQGAPVRIWKTHHKPWTYRGSHYIDLDDGTELTLSGQVSIEEIR